MRWEDERYVRLYIRDTPEEVALGWEACALWRELLRKFDRAGILELGKTGTRGLAGLTRIPLEVVERALPLLLEDGRVQLRGTTLVCPNFIAANDTPSSSTLRSQEWRGRQREIAAAEALLGSAQRNVPRGDEPSPNGTGGDATGRAGTLIRADPCRADPIPNPERDPASAGSGPPGPGPCPLGLEEPLTAGPGNPAGQQPKEPAPPPVAPLELQPAEAPKSSPAELVFAAFLAGRQRVMPGTRPPKLDDKRRKLILARLRDFPLEDVISAARGIWLSAWHLEQPSNRISLEIALRDAPHVERFRDIAARPELGRSSTPGVQQPAKPGEFQWKRAQEA